MTAITFETERSDGGWATWAVIGAMGFVAAAMMVWHANAPTSFVPQIATSAQDCAACHAGPTVLASATLGHADIGLNLVLAPEVSAVHTRQDCASCHNLR
ncbi:MAG: hypothetical protein AAFQ60_09390 [Pseudomonadota bacterium]